MIQLYLVTDWKGDNIAWDRNHRILVFVSRGLSVPDSVIAQSLGNIRDTDHIVKTYLICHMKPSVVYRTFTIFRSTEKHMINLKSVISLITLKHIFLQLQQNIWSMIKISIVPCIRWIISNTATYMVKKGCNLCIKQKQSWQEWLTDHTIMTKLENIIDTGVYVSENMHKNL